MAGCGAISPPLTNEAGDVRPLTEEDFEGWRPMREAMPELIEAVEAYRAQRAAAGASPPPPPDDPPPPRRKAITVDKVKRRIERGV